MEPQPADARAAPSACAPTTLSMAMPLPPSHPRSPVKGNMVSPRATHAASTWPEHQHETTACAPRGAHASHCQSLAHHTTLTGRCFKSVDTWAPLSEEPQSRSTTTTPAERLGNQGNSATLAAVHQYSLQQTTLSRASTRTPNTFCSKEQAPHSTTTAHLPGAERTAPHPAHGSPRESQRQTAHRTHAPTYATLKQTHKLTSLHPTSLQKGKGKAPPPPPTIEEETMEEGDDPDFVSDTPATTHATKAHAIAYARVFDATLGFPGEGPLIVATYNINGTRGTLAAVLAQAKQAKIDILLLQELHFYEDGEHGRVGSLADRQGWTLFSPFPRH